MSPPSRCSATNFVLALALCAAGGLPMGRIAIAEAPEGRRLMKELSAAFEGVEKALARGDAEAVSTHAGALSLAARKAPELKPQKNVEMEEEFRQHGARVAELASRAATLAGGRDLAAASIVFEEVRKTCVSCHLKFRGQDPKSGLFPARQGTVFGEVGINKLDGQERSDRSRVLVFLDGLKPADDFPLPAEHPAISQKDRQFSPRVLPVLKGTTVDFPNDDSIFHNVFSLCEACPFDLDIYEPGKSKSITFRKTGVVKIYCNIHPDMIATIVVLNNPFFALTDRRGLFVITGVPEGAYVLRTWHEFGGETRQEIAVTGPSARSVSIRIRESRETIEHRNKFGKPYPGPYR